MINNNYAREQFRELHDMREEHSEGTRPSLHRKTPCRIPDIGITLHGP